MLICATNTSGRTYCFIPPLPCWRRQPGYALCRQLYQTVAACVGAGGLLRTGNDSGHYGSHRHHHIGEAQRGQYGICMVCTLGHADRSGNRYLAVRPLRLPYCRLSGYCSGSSQHVFHIKGICRFPCAYRDEAMQFRPLPATACMGACTEYAADCFCAGCIAAFTICRRLHRILDIGCIGASYDTVYKDVCETVASLPKRNGQYDLLSGYGNWTSGGSGNSLPVVGCVLALSCSRCSRPACIVLLRPADVSLL